VTSRLIDSDTGVERLRVALGQRYYFADQRVTLPGVAARTGRRADVLASVEGKISQDFSLNTGWQYNPRDKITERFNYDLRYQPGFAQVVNLGFRYTRDVLRDLDLSAQWPLGGGWYGVARYNRSLRDHRVTEAIAGLEYAGDCWVFRTAFHRFATNENDVTQALFLQLELTDLASVGSSPLDLLRRTVGGYGTINQPVADPIFGQY
jgi:LPS-assembly protein